MSPVGVKFLFGVAVASAFTIVAARGETLRETLDQFGFFGTWALHCDEPASPSNVVRAAVVSPTGDPIFSETLGPNSEPNSYVILRAMRTDPGTIIIRTKLNGEIEQELTVRHDQDRVRTFDNRDVASGQYVVRDGVVTSNQSETPWLARCGDGSKAKPIQ